MPTIDSLNLAINMPEQEFSTVFLMFVTYAFIGWICEEIWCTVHFRKIVKRGMLFGPICPIYGFGAIAILYLLYPWRNTFVRLFIASVIITSILEYATSWLLEKLFHAKWWDYSDMPFNLNGRVCLLNSTAFGAGGLALEHIIHPFVEGILTSRYISPYIHNIGLGLAVLLTADVLSTLHRLVDFTSSMEKLRAYGDQLKERFENEPWFKANSLHEMLASIKEQAGTNSTAFSRRFLDSVARHEKRQSAVEFWLKRFPTMSSHEFFSELEHLKCVAKEKITEKKEKSENQEL